MVHWDGHEVSIISTAAGGMALIHRTLPKNWHMSFIHRHPVAALSVVLATFGILFPPVMVRVRRQMGLPTNNYDVSHPDMVRLQEKKLY